LRDHQLRGGGPMPYIVGIGGVGGPGG